MTNEDFDIDQRRLCSDGSCTGLLDEDGRCKECGKDALDEAVVTVTAAPTATEEDDFETRQLCSDGSCTGILGPDGRCKECGKSP